MRATEVEHEILYTSHTHTHTRTDTHIHMHTQTDLRDIGMSVTLGPK